MTSWASSVIRASVLSRMAHVKRLMMVGLPALPVLVHVSLIISLCHVLGRALLLTYNCKCILSYITRQLFLKFISPMHYTKKN